MLIAIIVIAIVVVLALGLFIYLLMRKSQQVVPDVTDRQTGRRDAVVGVDQEGRPVTASQEGAEAPRDDAGFEAVLKEELDELGRPSGAGDSEA